MKTHVVFGACFLLLSVRPPPFDLRVAILRLAEN